jgi:hypothetical protein
LEISQVDAVECRYIVGAVGQHKPAAALLLVTLLLAIGASAYFFTSQER